ncbi:MAG: ribonuclease P protein component [Lachnospiraceae bacterium]|jgi:ribonuclease P protein component|nr:ribonuclease P protein component [Lachnospiraceae bacterium]MBQ1641335.1 ribonuclease P protein component [Lachnospiraceae bacterium]MBQ2317485.1 ribonuclease P protein component [Lachnospiraceae bacterium]MBQ2578267.1 ribonuclease P protein component [Lachnospiraceae bacterium]MBQ4373228.1 ribonuclease P protein component [Lachnospiraceae bacterium]
MKFSDSLKKNKDFDAVYRAGNSKANRDFVMYIKNNGKETNRLGISVSKKVGNSVVRHHLARLIREAYRLHEEMFNSGLDIVVVVRPAAKEISYDQTVKSLLHLANLHHITINN